MGGGGGKHAQKPKFGVISSLSDMLQETLFMLTRYIYVLFTGCEVHSAR